MNSSLLIKICFQVLPPLYPSILNYNVTNFFQPWSAPWFRKPTLNHLKPDLQVLYLLLFGCSVASDSLRLHALRCARLPCLSPSPGACSDLCPLSWWCHPTISSSVTPFSSFWEPLMAKKKKERKWRGTKESLDEGERGKWKSWLKTQHSKN